MLREPSQPERDALAVSNQPSLEMVARLAMAYLASTENGSSEEPDADEQHNLAIVEAVDSAYAVLREIRRRGEALDAAAQAPTPPGKL